MTNFNLSTENAKTIKLTADIERLQKIQHIGDIVVGSIVGLGLFVACVILPIIAR